MSQYYDDDELDYECNDADDGLRYENFGYFYDAGSDLDRPGSPDYDRHDRDVEYREYRSDTTHDDRRHDSIDDHRHDPCDVHDDRRSSRQDVHDEPVFDAPDSQNPVVEVKSLLCPDHSSTLTEGCEKCSALKLVLQSRPELLQQLGGPADPNASLPEASSWLTGARPSQKATLILSKTSKDYARVRIYNIKSDYHKYIHIKTGLHIKIILGCLLFWPDAKTEIRGDHQGLLSLRRRDQ